MNTRQSAIREAISSMGIQPSHSIEAIYQATCRLVPEHLLNIGGQEKGGVVRILRSMGYLIDKKSQTITAIPHPNGEVTITRLSHTIEKMAQKIRQLEDEVRHWQREAGRNRPKVSQAVMTAMAVYGEE